MVKVPCCVELHGLIRGDGIFFHADIFLSLLVNFIHKCIISFFSTLSSSFGFTVRVEIMLIMIRGNNQVKESIIINTRIRVETGGCVWNEGVGNRFS